MKRVLAGVLVFLLVFSFTACTRTEKPPVLEKQSEDEIAMLDLLEAFYSDEENKNCVSMGQAVASDNAEGLLGVVNFTKEENPTWISFVGKEKNYSLALDKTYQLVPDVSEIYYLGGGACSVTLIDKETGDNYKYTLSYTNKNGKQNVKINSEKIKN